VYQSIPSSYNSDEETYKGNFKASETESSINIWSHYFWPSLITCHYDYHHHYSGDEKDSHAAPSHFNKFSSSRPITEVSTFSQSSFLQISYIIVEW